MNDQTKGKGAHTAGPWRVDRYPQTGGGYGFQIYGGHSISVANLSPGATTDRIETVAQANAARIVAAVNFIEGVDTDGLSELPQCTLAGTLHVMQLMTEEHRALRSERDSLAARVAELEAALAELNASAAAARAALAKVTP